MRYVIGLGGNLGAPVPRFARALELLEEKGVRVLAVSRVYRSQAIGPPQPPFHNAAARVECALSPPSLLSLLHDIEAALGRVRAERWGPRTLDLDILWCETPWTNDALSIPHPRLCERWFALKPLLEVAPELEARYGAVLSRLGPTPEGYPLRWRTGE